MKKLINKKIIAIGLTILALGFAGVFSLANMESVQALRQNKRLLLPRPPAPAESSGRKQESPDEERSEAGASNSLWVDIAENGNRFVFDETPLHPDGLPAYGNEFITEGYIYPTGTLHGTNGVTPDGSPEFPRLVIGRWTCRGWHVGEGAHTATGPWVVTHQLFDFGETFGAKTITTEGYELVDMNVPVRRAITGGTGIFNAARGDSRQVFLGFNQSNGVVLRVRLDVK
jgi:hypothetical protein